MSDPAEIAAQEWARVHAGRYLDPAEFGAEVGRVSRACVIALTAHSPSSPETVAGMKEPM